MIRASNPEPNAWVAGDVGARAKCDEAAAAACHNHVRLHPLKNRFTNPSERLGVATRRKNAQLAQFRTEMDTLLTELGNLEEHSERGQSRRRCATERPPRPCSASLTHPLQAVYPKLSAGRRCCGPEHRGGVGGGVRSEGQTGGPRAQLELDVGRPAVACGFELSREDGESVVYLRSILV